MSLTLGIDLGGTACKFGLVDESGHLSHQLEIDTRQHDGPDIMLPRLAEAAKSVLAQAGEPVLKGGIGVPGPVKHKEGVCVYAPNLTDWVDLPVGPRLSELIGIPISVVNDANAAALGESRFGAGQGADNVLVLTLGTGIGSGLLLNGRLHIGHSERGAEVGHMTVAVDDKRGSAGNVGTLESVCGRDAIVWRAMRSLTWGRESILHTMVPDLAELTPKHIADAAGKGDYLAKQVWIETASYLAVGVVNVVFTADVERVVIAGGVARAGDVLLDPLRRAVAARTSRLKFDVSQIVPAKLGPEAGAVGAGQWAREHDA
jgi:glucokinase